MMSIDRNSGLVAQAEFIESPNADDRPDDAIIDTVIVHSISLPPDDYGGPHIAELFTNTLDPTAHPYFEEIRDLRVSAHLLIRRDGSLTQFVPFHRRAWHAGQSDFRGRSSCNDFSIGIELEGSDTIPYADVQYRRLADVLRALFDTYPELSARRIAAHADVAPDRKTDPGPAFDWFQLYHRLTQTESVDT